MNDESRESKWQFPADFLVILFVMFGVPVIGISAGFVLPFLGSIRQGNPAPFCVSLACATAGVILLFFAKLPLYREKRYCTFGTKSLDKKHSRLYIIAYRFIGISIVAILFLILITKP